MPRRKEPIDLLQAKGKKHLTKSEIEYRKNTEVKADNDNIVAPPHLNEEQTDKFYKIASELDKIGIMSNLDCGCLARYIVADDLYWKTLDKINDEDVQDDIFELDKYTSLMDKYFKQCQSAAKELGLTISSRCKLIMPKTKEEPKQNKFAKFGGM